MSFPFFCDFSSKSLSDGAWDFGDTFFEQSEFVGPSCQRAQFTGQIEGRCFRIQPNPRSTA